MTPQQLIATCILAIFFGPPVLVLGWFLWCAYQDGRERNEERDLDGPQ